VNHKLGASALVRSRRRASRRALAGGPPHRPGRRAVRPTDGGRKSRSASAATARRAWRCEPRRCWLPCRIQAASRSPRRCSRISAGAAATRGYRGPCTGPPSWRANLASRSRSRSRSRNRRLRERCLQGRCWPGRAAPETCASRPAGLVRHPRRRACGGLAASQAGRRDVADRRRCLDAVAPSGAVMAFTGKVDIGQDNQTALRLLVAEELAVPPGRVTLVQGDTDLCPFDVGTFGSRSMPARRTAAAARRRRRPPGAD